MEYYLIVSTIMMFVGIYGFVTRRNLLAMLISVELILNSVDINFVVFNRFLFPEQLEGFFFTLFAIGISAAEPPGPTQYNPVTAVPATFAFTGDLAVELGKSLAKIPTKVGALVHAIGGGERDPETPISVVGASIIGGDTVDHGLWVAFWFFLAQLNFVLGAVNLVPLLPFDGGHIAVACYEKLRNMVRSLRGLSVGAPVNYMKLMPATYVVLIVVVGYMLLTVTADFVNPVRLFQ